MLMRAALIGPLLIAALLLSGYVWLHQPFAEDSGDIAKVPLSPDNASLYEVGDLQYLGGIDIPRMGQNIGGLSGLRWDAESGRLLAITDDARFVWITLAEEKNHIIWLDDIETLPMLGLDGEVLIGKEEGDSEALARDADGVWAVAFERKHRVLRYLNGLEAPPFEILFDPDGDLGGVEANAGMEAYAIGPAGQLMCAERAATPDLANCNFYNFAEDRHEWFPAHPPEDLVELGAVPTDADALSDGTFLILFRSYSPAEGNTAAIVAYTPDGTRREIATLKPPLTLDNFEGLAVREEGERTYLYIVSDDNFSGSQRTLLMKFEMVSE